MLEQETMDQQALPSDERIQAEFGTFREALSKAASHHTTQGIAFMQQGDVAAAELAFDAAVTYTQTTNTLGNLGVCKMRRLELRIAEEHLLEALNAARSPNDTAKAYRNLDALEQHWSVQRGSTKGGKYRRRAAQSRWSSQDEAFTKQLERWTGATAPCTLERRDVSELANWPSTKPLPDKPIIFTNATQKWPAWSLWSRHQLIEDPEYANTSVLSGSSQALTKSLALTLLASGYACIYLLFVTLSPTLK